MCRIAIDEFSRIVTRNTDLHDLQDPFGIGTKEWKEAEQGMKNLVTEIISIPPASSVSVEKMFCFRFAFYFRSFSDALTDETDFYQ